MVEAAIIGRVHRLKGMRQASRFALLGLLCLSLAACASCAGLLDSNAQGKLAQYQADVSANRIPTVKVRAEPANEERDVRLFSPEDVARLRKAARWWTKFPDPPPGKASPFMIVVSNETSRPVSGFTFRLSDLACGKGGKSLDYDLTLASAIAPAEKLAVSFVVTVGEKSVLRKAGLPCGEVTRAW